MKNILNINRKHLKLLNMKIKRKLHKKICGNQMSLTMKLRCYCLVLNKKRLKHKKMLKKNNMLKKTKYELAKYHGKQIASISTMDYFSDHSNIEESDVETNGIENFDYENLHLGWFSESSPKFHF